MLLLYVFSHSVVSDCLQPHDCSPPGSTVHRDSPGNNTGVGCMLSFRLSSKPRAWTPVSCIAGKFFTNWATREPKNTGVGSLSRVQGIFLAQELNLGLLHCRQILYQLSYQGYAACCFQLAKSLLQIIRLWDLNWWGCLPLEHCWFYGRAYSLFRHRDHTLDLRLLQGSDAH